MPNTPRLASSKIPRGEARRQELIVEAARILLRDGLDGTSMDLIASEAGASKATLYRHFGDRHGLVVAVVQYLCSDFLADIVHAPPPDTDLRAALHGILSQLIHVLSKPTHPDFFRLIVTVSRRAPEIGATWHEHGPLVWHAMMRAAFADARARGELPTGFDAADYPEMLFDAVFADMIIRTAVLGEQVDTPKPPGRYLEMLLDMVSSRIDAHTAP